MEGTTSGAGSVSAEREEFLALGRIAHAMLTYGGHAHAEVDRWQWNFDRLGGRHRALLPGMAAKIEGARAAVDANAAFLADVVEAGEQTHDVGEPLSAARAYEALKRAPAVEDVSKVRYVLKNLVRDWSAEGAAERAQSFGWLLDTACDLFPDRSAAATPPCVLTPGAGLARLPLEFAARGFDAVGNEFSYYMLLTSSFMINCMPQAGAYRIHPFALGTCNQASDAAQLRGVPLPDRAPEELLRGSGGSMAMVAGDFLEVFSTAEHAAAFDAVATCFFIDTAHNVIDYIEVIHHCLKPGGYWLNMGPLLYHWRSEGTAAEPEASLELSLEDVESVALQCGFERVASSLAEAVYLGDCQGMYSTSYTCARWVMRKRPIEPTGDAGAAALAPQLPAACPESDERG